MTVLNGFPILIVEDDDRVAMTLVKAVKKLAGCPVGPVTSVSEALALLNTSAISAAIVDAILIDRNVTPLALALIEMDIPFVVYTGSGLPDELAELHPGLPVVPKPTSAAKVLAALLDRASFKPERLHLQELRRIGAQLEKRLAASDALDQPLLSVRIAQALDDANTAITTDTM